MAISAVSVLKKKNGIAMDVHSNEFSVLDGLSPEASPVKARDGTTGIRTEQQSTKGQKQEDVLSSRWIRDNVKITQTRKRSQVVWTPWKNGSELAMIRDWFFPQHATQDPYYPPTGDLRKQAIDIVNRWEDQNRDLELPHSILATSSLTDAVLHDTRPTTARAQHISDRALQSIYAMAFCRFVNGFVDRDVSKSSLIALASTTVTNEDGSTTSTSHGESSMYALASKIGLPLHFVEMRHQITHEHMPTIEELAELTEEALEWIYWRWWKVYAEFDAAEAWQHWTEVGNQRPSNDIAVTEGKRGAGYVDG